MYKKKSEYRINFNFLYILFIYRPEDLHRIRVEHMERQLANLTGLVQKALTHNPQLAQSYLATAPGQYRTGRFINKKIIYN